MKPQPTNHDPGNGRRWRRQLRNIPQTTRVRSALIGDYSPIAIPAKGDCATQYRCKWLFNIELDILSEWRLGLACAVQISSQPAGTSPARKRE